MRSGIVASVCLLMSYPASTHALTWTRVPEVPAAAIRSVELHGTTLYAASTDTVFLGAALGTIWSASSALGASVAPILATLPAGGFLWAGTFGQGVFRGSESGSSWNGVSNGLSGLGSDHIVAFEVRDDTLFAATDGAGVFALDLATPNLWVDFNNGLPVFLSGGMGSIILSGTTLLAPGGGNGFVYRLPQGATAWEEIAVRPPILAGFVASDIYSDGSNILVTNGSSLYRSTDDGQSWALAGSGLAAGGSAMFFAKGGSTFYVAMDFLNNTHQFFASVDDGESWQPIEGVMSGVVYEIEVAGDKLFSGQQDGLWWVAPPTTPVHPTTWGQIKARFAP